MRPCRVSNFIILCSLTHTTTPIGLYHLSLGILNTRLDAIFIFSYMPRRNTTYDTASAPSLHPHHLQCLIFHLPCCHPPLALVILLLLSECVRVRYHSLCQLPFVRLPEALPICMPFSSSEFGGQPAARFCYRVAYVGKLLAGAR